MRQKLCGLVCAVALILVSPSYAAQVKFGSSCKKLGEKRLVQGSTFICSKVGNKLVWIDLERVRTAPSPAPTVTVTAQPSPAPTVTVTAQPSPAPTVTVTAQPSPAPTVTVTAQPSPAPTVTVTATPALSSAPQYSVNYSDLQFIYGNAGCGGKIGFIRANSQGALVRNKTIVSTNASYQVDPLDYRDGQLLFSTKPCNSQIGSKTELWSLNLANPKARAKRIYSISYKGFRDGLLVDAKFDIATNKVLILGWTGGDSQVYTAETSPLVAWSSLKQGWLSTGIIATAISVGTGQELFVFGDNSSNWRSVSVDWRTEIDGIGKITPLGFGRANQYQGTGVISGVVTGITASNPYVFSTSQGLFVCSDYPSTSGPSVNVDFDQKCSRASGSQYGLAVSWVGCSSPNKTCDGLISSRDQRAYVYEWQPLFGEPKPVKLLSTINLKGVFESIPGGAYSTVSTFEFDFDIGILAPSITFQGTFFS